MEIKTNLQDCKECGVYLNIETVEKQILNLKYKEEYLYIYGFICPVCKKYHFRKSYNFYIIGNIAKEDKSFDKGDFFTIEKYICHKLGIEDKYGSGLKEYDEDENEY